MLSYRTGPKGTHLHQQGRAVNEAGFLPVIRELGRLRFLMTGKQSKGAVSEMNQLPCRNSPKDVIFGGGIWQQVLAANYLKM